MQQQGVGQQQGGQMQQGGQQQQGQQQQQQQAQHAVNQAVQNAMRQQQQQGGAPQSITDLAVNYMTAMASKNGQQGGGGQGGQVQMPSAQNQMAAALMQQQANALSAAQSAAAGGGAGGFNFDPRLSYPMMSHMNTLNAMGSMPNLISLQQQYGNPGMANRAQYGGLDPAAILSVASQNLLTGLDQRKSRHIKSPQQLKTLKLFFQTNQRPSKEDIRKLVKDTGLPHQEVTRWFRNERHKEKKSQEAKQEAIQGHIKGNAPMHQQQHPGMHPNMMVNMPPHLMQQQQQHMQQQQQQQQQPNKQNKRKRGGDDDGSDTGSENGEDAFQRMLHDPTQRFAAVQSLLANMTDPNEIAAAEKVLEEKRLAMGGEAGVPLLPALQGAASSPDGAWNVLQQVFAPKDDSKRRKGNKTPSDVAAAAAAAGAAGGNGGINPEMLHGLTAAFAKHPEYLKEINKNLSQQ